MNKKFIPLIVLVIIFIPIIIIHNSTKSDSSKLYLSSKYYNAGEFIDITSEELNKNKSENYIVFTYNNYCSFQIPCETVFKSFMEKYNIDFLYIPYEDFKNTDLYKTVKYAPSIIIVSKGEIVAYLDAEEDADVDKYQDDKIFEGWIKKYINVRKNTF